MLRPILTGLFDLLAPPHCPGCDLPSLEAHRFCDACAPLLERTDGAHQLLAGYVYGGPLADALRRFKYGSRAELSASLVPLLSAVIRPLSSRFEGIAFVPLHPLRLRQRGFDQAGLLAHGLGRALGIPVWGELLSRRRSTEVQASLDRGARSANVRDAFAASPRARGRRVLVLDDVRTTGATLADASRALTGAGATVTPYALALADVDDVEPHEHRA